jgi:Zn-dependent protease
MHEYAHGYVASRCGDQTAKHAGRITLNPVPHIDPFGSIFLPLLLILTGSHFFIAWAKPVPVDPRNFKKPGRDDIIVSLAGPATNLLLAFFFTFLAIIGQAGRGEGAFVALIAQAMFVLSKYGILINLFLALFNLIPIPPLDGAHIVRQLLPPGAASRFDSIGRYGFIILLGLAMTPLLRFIFFPAYGLFWLLLRLISMFA